MDVSGGSGQPRSGNDEQAEHPATPTAPATGPTDHPGPEPHDAPAPPPTPPRPAPDPGSDADPETSQQATGPSPTPDEAPQPAGPQPTADEPGEAAGPGPRAAEPGESAGPGPRADEPGEAAGPGPRAAEEGRAVSPEPQSVEDGRAASPGPRGNEDGRAASPEPRATEDGRAGGPEPTVGEDRSAARPDAGSRGGTPTARPEPPAPTDTPAADGGPHSPEHRSLAHSGIAKGEPPQPRPKEPGGGLLMGRPFGVPVYVAPSWFLVAALITWVFGGQLDRVLPELGAARYLVSLFFAVAFYASVLVHELAHTVAAIRFDLPVRRIQLQFFGGVSEIEKEAETPGREFVLAFVGPLLSLVLAGLFYLAMKPVEPDTVPGVLLAGLMISNLIVAAFNLLPGLPLDGGRMLRAVVWKITGKPMSGTVAAAWVGRALALSVLVGLPLLNQSGALGGGNQDISGMDTVTDALLAAILAAIIWTGAGNSLRMARLREHLPELRARTLTRRAVPVQTDTPLSEALRRANAAGARALVVVDADGNPLSLVREAAIVGVPEHRRPWVAVSGLAQELTDGMRVSAELAGEALLDTLRATPATEYLVVEESGEIYGVLSAADVERAFVRAMARPS
ncbi:site-2 protease family protein [Streptomyces sp. NPDC020362]|uniref:site-2 protease family protein n=1 Tax=unclassified Streptomyces TaxID=2593676 RepID=UPI0033D4F1E6